MIDNEFERKGREMSDKLNQIVDLEYTWGDFPALTAEQIYKAYDARAVCAQVTTCNGAAILALEKRIAELERERDAATKRAEQAEASAVRWEKRANQAAGRALEFRDAWKDADTDARRLAHIAKNVRIVSESENNLIEKYAK